MKHYQMSIISKLKKNSIPLQGNHAGNKLKHVKHSHEDHYKRCLEAKGDPPPKRKKPTPVAPLKGVVISGESLQLNCLRLITEHCLPFRMLNFHAFQNIVKPIVNALPANEK